MGTNINKKMTRCNCSTWEFGTYGPDGSAESYDAYGTGCLEMTTRTFAMGHDAKLVGYMVRAELASEDIRQGNHTFADAEAAARSISDALAIKARAQLDAAKARIAKKAAREAAKTARKSAKAAAPAPTTREARIKAGRWEYDAIIDIATGEATHNRKMGGTRTLALGEYKEI